VALEDALQHLDEEANQEIARAIGDLLRQRAAREDWRECPILQHLETGAPNLHLWNELFRRTRQALEDDNALPRKAQGILNPSAGFDLALDDFIAEMIAVQYLAALGHQGIQFPAEGQAVTADVISSRDGITYVTEAKNLRAPNGLSYVAFARWHHDRAAAPQRYNFAVDFLELENPFEDLTPAQAAAVRQLVDDLPERARPATFQVALPGGRTLRVRVSEGERGMMRHGPGPFLVDPLVEECQRAVVVKLMEPTRKALLQLYSAAIPVEWRRLLFIRWKPPEDIGAIGEAERVRTAVRDGLQTLIRQFFPNFAVAIVHTYENLENAPRVAWL